MKTKKIRELLLTYQDEQYRDFVIKLSPEAKNVIGIRIPILRKLADNIVRESYDEAMEFLHENKYIYYEELFLKGIIISNLRDNINIKIKEFNEFVPKIYDWSICDSTVSGIKIGAEHKREFYDYIIKYKNSHKEFQLRFMIVVMLNYYIDNENINMVLKDILEVKDDFYYVNMAKAWLIQRVYVFNKEIANKFLESEALDNYTYIKSLQKICESRQVSKEEKEIIREKIRSTRCNRR